MPHLELELESPYREDLEGILCFSSFGEAEETLHRLESWRQRYQSANDRKGLEHCRNIARLGRRRAESIGRNTRVNRMNRLRKQEIAHWFEIWLQTPDIFASWLELRKHTDEFGQLLQSEPLP